MTNFNKIGAGIKETFPYANIIGNAEKVPQIGGFDVYIRGVGPPNERDRLGRYLIFSKAKSNRFPNP